MNADCQARIRWIYILEPSIYAWSTCGQPAVVMLRGGCVHEHIREIAICAEHEAMTGEMGIGCEACFDAGHDCSMVFRLGERL